MNTNKRPSILEDTVHKGIYWIWSKWIIICISVRTTERQAITNTYRAARRSVEVLGQNSRSYASILDVLLPHYH